MLGATRLARTSVLSLLFLGVFTPVYATVIADQPNALIPDTISDFNGVIVQPHILTTGISPLDIYQLGIYVYGVNPSTWWHNSFTAQPCPFISGNEDAYAGLIEDGRPIVWESHFQPNLLCDYDTATHFFRMYPGNTDPLVTLKPNTSYSLLAMRSELSGPPIGSGREILVYGSNTVSATSTPCYSNILSINVITDCDFGPSPQLTSMGYFIAGDLQSRPALPATTTPPSGPSSVLFLPGIESSRLYRPDYSGGTDKLWEPNIDADIQDLYLGSGGTGGRSDIYTKERDIIDTDPTGKDIYKPFLNKMDGLKSSGTIADWEPIAYDWRLSLDELLSSGHDIDGRIYYTGDLAGTSTPYIIQELRRLASTSKSGKVTIVAHSNGGLVAKRLTEVLGPAEASNLIDRIIFVAVPQVGTPMAIAAGMHGYDQDHGGGFIESKNSARTFASTSPMFYNLLPSQGYFTQVDNSVVYFDYPLTDWISRYGGVVHSQERLNTFVTDSYLRANPQTGNINQPIQLDAGLLAQANELHAHLDTWTPPAGVDLIQIAGWGVPSLSGITYRQTIPGNQSTIAPDVITTIDGDGTVVTPSALWTSGSFAKNYWMNLKKYNNSNLLNTSLGIKPFEHSRILSTNPVNDFISDLIASSTKSLADYQYLSTTAPVGDTTSLRYALHSPLTLNLYDTMGHHTGISTSTGEIEEQIPGTYYMELGDVKYIFTDASSSAHIQMSGYATSTFTFNVDQMRGDTLIASTTFKDVPVTPTTQVNLDVVSDISTLSPMHIDLGDGLVHSIAPKPDGVATLDLTSPEITLAFSTSTNTLTPTAIDDSGLAAMTGTTSFPILKKGQSGVATTTLIATDPSGNSTQLIYTFKYPAKDRRIAITPVSIVSNGKVTKLLNTFVKYKWNIATSSSYSMFASYLQTTSTSTESHFRPKKNVTIVMSKPIDLDDGDTDDDVDARSTRLKLTGLVIPSVSTNQGKISVTY